VPSPSSLLCKLCRGRHGFCTEPHSACCAITQFVTVQAVQRKVSALSHTALVVPSPSPLLCKLCRGRFLHQATQRLLCASSSPRTFLSTLNHRTLRISLRMFLATPYCGSGTKGDTFRYQGGHQIECDSRTPKDSAGASNRGRLGPTVQIIS
jgi:hypothetical protein